MQQKFQLGLNHEDGEGSREAMGAVTESTWSVQHGKEDTEGRAHCGLHLPEERQQRGRIRG